MLECVYPNVSGTVFYDDFVSLLYNASDLQMNSHRFDNLSVDGLV